MKKPLRSLIAIFACVILFTQLLPLAEGAGSSARVQAEAETKRIEALQDQSKQKINDARDAWKTAKDAADDAKKIFRADKTDAKKTAWKQAQAKETIAYKAWKQTIKDFKNLKT